MAYKRLPVVVANQCTGCGLCIDACAPRSLEMVNGIATLVGPDTCGSEEHCIAVCKDDAIRMVWLPFAGTASVGAWSASVAPGEPAREIKNPPSASVT